MIENEGLEQLGWTPYIPSAEAEALGDKIDKEAAKADPDPRVLAQLFTQLQDVQEQEGWR
jgi:hypothetical protein